MTAHRKIFVAYSSQDQQLADLIFDAVRRANAQPIPYQYTPWQFNDVSGTHVVSPILENISEAPYIVADITYLNLNVVYEIGFAIGSGKKVFLVRSKSIDGDKTLANEAGIFDTLGYYEYSTHQELIDRLLAHIDDRPLAIADTLDRKAPVYVVEPPTRSEAVTISISRIKKAGLKYRSFNPSEDTRLSSIDAIRQVSSSSGVVVVLQPETVAGSKVNNVRSMFVAGLADGLERPKLMMAPTHYVAPLDVRDDVVFYRDQKDIIAAIVEFAPAIVEYLTQSEKTEPTVDQALAALSVGDPTAENEMTTLSSYYLRTDEYARTLRGEVNLVTGRKGSGKTALFIQVRDRIRADKKNVVVDLKPEGYQLLKLKEEILSFLSDGARHHLITAFWEYLILLEVAYKLLEKDRQVHKFNHEIYDLYLELDRAYHVEQFSVEGDFSERLLFLSSKISQEYKARFGGVDGKRLTNEEVTQLLYTHDIRVLRERIMVYLEKKGSVWILFDNLDKGWSTQGVDVIDSIVLRCLIDAGRKIEREMRKGGREFHCIVFVRNDVYDHVMRNSSDYGKEMRAVLDWTDADLLKEMLRLRLVNGLGITDSSPTFEQLWQQICYPLYKGEETSSFFVNCSLMRPRNLLKIFNHCRGFAVNFGHARIGAEDIDKGFKAFSHDLLSELDHELSDVTSSWKDLLYQFIDAPSVMSDIEIKVLLREANIESDELGKVLDFLLYYGIIGIRTPEVDHYIYDVMYDERTMKARALRSGEQTTYVVNPAFWPALEIQDNEISGPV